VKIGLPRNLAESPVGDHDVRFRDWRASLPAVVADLAGRWELTVGEPFEPGGQCSWVAPARTLAGDDVALKVGWRHYEADHEAAGLRFWDGAGAVRVHRAEAYDRTSALLLERCVPGDTLASARPAPECDEVVAGLLRRLWRTPPTGHPFRELTTMCDAWADAYERTVEQAPQPLDPGLARAGIELMRELPRTATDSVVLCTDLHPQNVLAARREPWLMIDPKPYIGDPCYDALQHMLNTDRLVADPEALSDRMAAMLDLDPRRLRLWLFARCVQEGPTWPGLDGVAVRLAP